MDFLLSSLVIAALSTATGAQNPPGTTEPLATYCTSSKNVLCMNHYAAVLPYHFYRYVPTDSPVPYGDTIVGEPPANNQTAVPASNHSSADNPFATGEVAKADFLIFDEKRGKELLGKNPTNDFMFKVTDAVHEAPVYVPYLNRLYLSILAPPIGTLPQLIVDLNADPPTLSEFVSDPPVYAPNGGTYHNGLIYFGASGGNDSIGGTEQRVRIATVDPRTNKSVTLLDNYYGYYFNTIDDLVVDSHGDIWFTDPFYTWFNGLTDEPPQLPVASYRFNPKTGAVNVIEDTIKEPNGITFSPDGKHVYISDTGAVAGDYSRNDYYNHGTPYNWSMPRYVYKFDVSDGGKLIGNKRPIWLAQDWIPDGLKTAANGYVLTGAGRGVDILDDVGTLLVRIQTNYTVQ